MIKDLGNINLEAHVKNDEFESLVNHIIQINGRIQNSVWEGGLLRSIHKYKALRSCIKSPNEEGILDSLWKSYPYDRTRTYTKLIKEFIPKYVNWVARKTSCLAHGVSIQKGRNLKLGVPKLPKVKYELPLKLKAKLDDSIPVHYKQLS